MASRYDSTVPKNDPSTLSLGERNDNDGAMLISTGEGNSFGIGNVRNANAREDRGNGDDVNEDVQGDVPDADTENLTDNGGRTGVQRDSDDTHADNPGDDDSSDSITLEKQRFDVSDDTNNQSPVSDQSITFEKETMYSVEEGLDWRTAHAKEEARFQAAKDAARAEMDVEKKDETRMNVVDDDDVEVIKYGDRDEIDFRGGHLNEFVDSHDDYNCRFCDYPRKDPVQIKTCGHSYCKRCWIYWHSSHGTETTGNCILCHRNVKLTHVFIDKSQDRIIRSQNVYCNNKKDGCEVIKQLWDINVHHAKCDYQTVVCDIGCTHSMYRKDLAGHLANDCPHRLVNCDMCDIQLQAMGLQMHAEICPMKPITCEYCQTGSILQKEMPAHHQTTCAKFPTFCSLALIGCTTKLAIDHKGWNFVTDPYLHGQGLGGTVVVTGPVTKNIPLTLGNLPQCQLLTYLQQKFCASPIAWKARDYFSVLLSCPRELIPRLFRDVSTGNLPGDTFVVHSVMAMNGTQLIDDILKVTSNHIPSDSILKDNSSRMNNGDSKLLNDNAEKESKLNLTESTNRIESNGQNESPDFESQNIRPLSNCTESHSHCDFNNHDRSNKLLTLNNECVTKLLTKKSNLKNESEQSQFEINKFNLTDCISRQFQMSSHFQPIKNYDLNDRYESNEHLAGHDMGLAILGNKGESNALYGRYRDITENHNHKPCDNKETKTKSSDFDNNYDQRLSTNHKSCYNTENENESTHNFDNYTKSETESNHITDDYEKTHQMLSELYDSGNNDNHYSSDEYDNLTPGEFCPDSTFGESMCEDVVSELESSGSFGSSYSPKPPKPPNVLVYCGKKDSVRKFDTIKRVLENCLNSLQYTIYCLKHGEVKNGAWLDSTALIVIASEHLYDDIDIAFLDFFKQGGNVISFGSSLDQRIVKRKTHLTSTLNLIKVELLNCDVKDIKDSKSDHIKSDGPDIEEGTKIGDKNDTISLIGSKFCYDLETVIDEGLKVECVVKVKDTDDLPVVVKARRKDGVTSGTAILSQAHLEKDPSELAAVSEVFRELKASNSARFDLLTHLLRSLGLNCDVQTLPDYTPAYLFARDETIKSAILTAIKPRLKNNVLRSESKSLAFPLTNENVFPTDTITPVLTDTGAYEPVTFNPEVYFKELTTKCLGNTLIYADVLPTTMNILDGLKFSAPESVGLIAVAGRQTAGKGRGGNVWLSPVGCAMFSLHVRFPVQSWLGQRSPYIQHIASLAAILSVRSMAGYEDVDMKLKWPNDIYFGSTVKLGGVIVNSTIMGGDFHAIIGIGVNVNNSNPTACINDVITQHRTELRTHLSPVSVEEFISRTVSQIEVLVTDFQRDGREKFCELYYKYWLHSGAKVKLESEGGKDATIRGLDNFGYMEVDTDSGDRISVQPDGNSFDMLKGLISLKRR